MIVAMSSTLRAAARVGQRGRDRRAPEAPPTGTSRCVEADGSRRTTTTRESGPAAPSTAQVPYCSAAPDERHRGAGVRTMCSAWLGGVRRVDRDRDGARRHDRQVGDRPPGRVGREDGHAVARRRRRRRSARRRPRRCAGQLAVRDPAPLGARRRRMATPSGVAAICRRISVTRWSSCHTRGPGTGGLNCRPDSPGG